MQIPKQMSLTEAKTFIQSMIKKSGLNGFTLLDEMMKYSDQSDMIELSLRCVCIDRDIERLKEIAMFRNNVPTGRRKYVGKVIKDFLDLLAEASCEP